MLLRALHWPDAHPFPAHVDERIAATKTILVFLVSMM
jgi:hypothetical protein